jgi:hypothetical protein
LFAQLVALVGAVPQWQTVLQVKAYLLALGGKNGTHYRALRRLKFKNFVEIVEKG